MPPGAIPEDYQLLSQKFAPMDLIVLQGHYRGAAFIFQFCASLAEPAGYAIAIGSNRPFKCGINGLTCRIKFLMEDAFVVEEGNQQCFDLGFLQTTLFGSGEVGEQHAIDCRFDFGSKW